MKHNIWKYSTLILLFAFLITFYFTPLSKGIIGRFKPKKEHVFSEHWKDQSSYYAKQSCKNKIVFLGNSITEFGNWSELIDRTDVANRGISGDVAKGVFIRSNLYVKQSPKAVFIKIGINDIREGNSIDSTFKYIVKAAKIYQSHKIPVFVQSVIPTNRQYIKLNKSVQQLNQKLIKELNVIHIPFINLTNAMSKKGHLNDNFSSDGIHLNGNGYMAYKQVLMPYINNIH